MNRLNLVKILGAAAVLSGLAMSNAAADNTGHDTHIACYASVHTECYGNGQNNCSEEVYNAGLDECDDGFGNTDTLFGIDELRGSMYADTLTGADERFSRLRGGDGADTLTAGSVTDSSIATEVSYDRDADDGGTLGVTIIAVFSLGVPALWYLYLKIAVLIVLLPVAFVWINSLTGLAGLLHATGTLPVALPLWLVVVAIGALIGTQLGLRWLPVRTLRQALGVVLLIAAGKLMFA